jgi:hypothetical protein
MNHSVCLYGSCHSQATDKFLYTVLVPFIKRGDSFFDNS